MHDHRSRGKTDAIERAGRQGNNPSSLVFGVTSPYPTVVMVVIAE